LRPATKKSIVKPEEEEKKELLSIAKVQLRPAHTKSKSLGASTLETLIKTEEETDN